VANFLSLETTPPVYPTSGVGLGGRTTHWARGTYTISAALAAADTIQLFDLPRNARVLAGGFIKSDDLDTGGTAIRVNVGDAGSASRYFSASAAPSTGAVDTTMAFAGVDYVNTAKTRVFATVSVAPTTGATTGTFTVMLPYIVEEPA
jgi:hypothetical protein